MSWDEIMELREELKDIRKKVGGAAVKFDKDRGTRSIDDDVNELRKDLHDLREMIKDISDKMKHMENASIATSAELDAQISSLASDLQSSTTELEETVKTKNKAS
jgi:uncharacterized membrane protein